MGKRGPKPWPKERVRSRHAAVRVTAIDFKLLQEAAKREGVNVSALMRRRLGLSEVAPGLAKKE